MDDSTYNVGWTNRGLLYNARRSYQSNRAIWIIIFLGIVLRVGPYLGNRSLWSDESRAALDIIGRPLSSVLTGADRRQTAPRGFVVLSKLTVMAFGESEYVLRLVPLAAGIIALFLFLAVAKRCIKPQAIPLAVLLFAISHPLVRFSSELKQYSSDVAFALLLCWLALVLESKRLRGSWMVVFGLVGAIAIWFSHPAMFVLAGAGLTLWVSALMRRDWRGLGYVSLAGLCWMTSFLTFYFASLHAMVSSERLLTYWKEGFMPFPPLSVSDAKWFIATPFSVFKHTVGFTLPGVAVFAFIVGCRYVFAEHKQKSFILISPILFALLASALGRYPFQGRLLLFAVPCFLLWVAEGAVHIASRARNGSAVIGGVFLGLLLLHPTLRCALHLITPRTQEEIKPVLSHVQEHYRDGDVIYVYYSARLAFEYYSPRYGLDDAEIIEGISSRKNWNKYRDDLGKLQGSRRVWVIFSHVHDTSGVDEERLFLSYLERMGRMLDAVQRPGASAYLYDMRISSEDRQRNSPKRTPSGTATRPVSLAPSRVLLLAPQEAAGVAGAMKRAQRKRRFRGGRIR